jgi:hypothetical protein
MDVTAPFYNHVVVEQFALLAEDLHRYWRFWNAEISAGALVRFKHSRIDDLFADVRATLFLAHPVHCLLGSS